MTPRPCLKCGRPTTKGPRCPACERDHQRRRNATRPHYDAEWRKISKAAIAAHLETVGPWCPGWRVPAHGCDPSELTTDHVVAGDPTRVQVLCRSCNSRKSVGERGRRAQG